LNIQYIGNDFLIDCQAHTITVEGRCFEIRPKTFQLLLALVEHKNQIIDKQTLLNDIWHDVNVDEQVIFQSIGEIRKAFSGKKVIQTHPRKGYSWVESIQKSIKENHPSALTPSKPQPSKELPTDNSLKTQDDKPLVQAIVDDIQPVRQLLPIKVIATVLFAILIIIGLWVYFSQNSDEKISLAQETIFILPTKNHIQDKKYEWVSMGIMDTLITQAKNSPSVMPLDYVLLSMRNVDMDRNYSTEQISRLSKITAAGLIVESEISRTLDQYQLIYHLHFTQKTVRDVIFSNSIDNLVSKLSQVIANITHTTIEDATINASKFNHELFVEAIALSQSGKLEASIQLLKGLIVIEPNNIAAHKVLIDWLQYRGDYQSALNVSEQLINIAENKQTLSTHDSAQKINDAVQNEKAGIYYRHAYNLFTLGYLDKAWKYVKQLDQQLEDEINPYYHGFSMQLKGELQLAQRNFPQARNYFLQALKQFKRIYFSIGITSVYCLLAEAEEHAGNKDKSVQYLELARKTVKKYEIKNLLQPFKIKLEM